ncbi:MAG TPA: hypothetical protein VFU27_00905 [Terriglobales bacterium]|nr:hypothetical protein [Terriglobales bacterium]
MNVSRSTLGKIAAALAVIAVLWLGRVTWDYFDPNSPANVAMQEQLKLFGRAMYEYHAETGQWPSMVDDLAHTTLAARSHVWRQTASGVVLLWPRQLSPEPKDNSNVLLAYWNAGLYNRLGKVWVCWGDLRTQRMSKSELGKQLSNGRNP